MRKARYLALLLISLTIASANLIKIRLKNKIIFNQQNIRDEDMHDQGFIDKLFNHNQQLYSGEIKVGLSQQKFQVDFDTGSSLLWLTSKECKSCLRDGFKNSYQCKQDDGCIQTGIPASIGYEDGSSVKGYIANVPISISNLQPITNSVLIVEQSFKNKDLETDGLMGLGVYDQYNSKNIPYVESLFRQGIIQKSQFSFYLGFGENESELVIGGYDSNKMQDENKIYYHPILLNEEQNNDQDWSMLISSISFDEIQIPITSKNIAIVDSGTSTICIRKDIYQIWIKHLKENYDVKQKLSLYGSYYTVKCSRALPDLNFVLPDKEGIQRVYSVPSSFYVFKQSNKCYLGVESQSIDDDVQFILGDVFMRRFVSIYDYSSLSIGLTQSISDPINYNQQNYDSQLQIICISIIFLYLMLISKNKIKL
ncbi:eukaryotic aspartyl protease family protein (macronuclear) [Tetrahymena thermophila SB210]|uniref:Eukaryotic aspartyl protease family protein n=1 Tax=Tetrahymena thermophila (strain SB210) TaxID=312017 RepID=Q24DJ9_TETTS|nr:eukaryotic aspartyl protease family protein [Tetrahymena thermophila SB210]EAS05849.2 eukaryotic aspartyl protease family protein [Tetrahymena thermophila SB210]|eukprot:XP_001026094.2 eukaryotic aspartyl protease family protein [Tetrahymena thermophila SB210]